jgi:hypothetical protein
MLRKKMVDPTDTPIGERLARYAAARGIEPRSAEYRELLTGYRANPQVFGELLDVELARIQKNDKRG